MRKLNFILFITLTSLLISCDKDDSETIVVDEALIAGDWNLVGFETKNGKTFTEVQGQTLETSYSSYGKDFDTVVTFSENPNTVTSSGSYTTVLEYTVLGETTNQTVPGEQFSLGGTWRLEGGNRLITSIDDENDSAAEIISLTDDEMILQLELNETIEEQGIKIKTTGTVVQTLKRQ